MFTRRLSDCKEIIAPDGCRLQELLHPHQAGIDLPYSLAAAEIDAGHSTTPHRLLAQTETYLILAGTGVIHVGEHSQAVAAGDLVLVPANVAQWVENTGTTALRFTVIVSPPWQAADDVPVI